VFVIAGACGPDAPTQDACAGKPDFIVRVQPKEDLLPRGTRVELLYGGGSKEPYEIGKANRPQVMFCDPKPLFPEASGSGGAAGHAGSNEAGSGGSEHGVSALVCELWTSGPASLTVLAPGFEKVERNLELEPEECPLEELVELSKARPPL
jgi:hypothetical protein